jgi:hypothetical protein
MPPGLRVLLAVVKKWTISRNASIASDKTTEVIQLQ